MSSAYSAPLPASLNTEGKLTVYELYIVTSFLWFPSQIQMKKSTIYPWITLCWLMMFNLMFSMTKGVHSEFVLAVGVSVANCALSRVVKEGCSVGGC